MRKVVVLVFAFLLPLFVFTQISWAKTDEVVVKPKEVNSYELFWPMVAGKTLDDKMYPLKIFKEKLRGFLIFGKAQKAENAVFLATKRLLEAEKLLNENKVDLADKTLRVASAELQKANSDTDISLKNGVALGESGQGMANKLGNIDKFVSWLLVKNGENKELLQNILDSATSLATKIK